MYWTTLIKYFNSTTTYLMLKWILFDNKHKFLKCFNYIMFSLTFNSYLPYC